MKLKINKASDLNSISVLPPHARRSNGVSYAPGPKTSQLRSQASQQSLSQGLSSQHGAFSQISQNSLDEVLTNDQRFCSQEREIPAKKAICLPPTSHSHEESQMPNSRSSTTLMRKWSSASFSDHRCQVSEELEHRIGMMETSLSRFAMILDSVQSDVMQVNKGTKEVSMEMEGVRQKLVVQDSSLQSMNKGHNDIKASLDDGFKSISEQVNKNIQTDKLQEMFSALSALSEKIQASIQSSQHELHNSFNQEIQAMTRSLINLDQKDQVRPVLPPKIISSTAAPRRKPPLVVNSAVPQKFCVQPTVVPKIETGGSKTETGGWKSVKMEKSASANMASNRVNKQKVASSIQKNRECRVIIDSDEESNDGFSCLLKENETLDLGKCLIEEVKEETNRILRRARRRKRQCCNTIIIN